MKFYAIAQSRVTDSEQLNKYVAAASPTLAAHNIKILAYDEAPIVVEGALELPRTVILEFDSRQAFYDWYESPEYRAARELRLDAAIGHFILVQGID
jgi:uncharacterized protein (DUF1330 family)